MAEDDYILTRDLVDDNRINLQHYLWIELFGYHIHPVIPSSCAHLRIADVGTGTGIWLTDLARRLPTSVTLDGLDVSFDATPPPKCLPPNVNLHHYDVTREPPVHLRGVCDIVHIRLFSYILADDQIDSVVRNLVQLLKPGGYLQWGEPSIPSFRIETLESDCKTEALTELVQVFQEADRRLRPTWAPELPEVFNKAGLEGIQVSSAEAPPYMALAKHKCNFVLLDIVARKTQNIKIAEKLKELSPHAAKETRDGAFYAFTRFIVVGRKRIDGN